MRKMNFSAHVLNVFDEMKTSYDEVKNLMFDLYKNELEDGITKREAEDKLREVSLKILVEKENVLIETMVVSSSMLLRK